MSDITVIGLGLMGSALARAIQNAGHALMVWNRSAGKMQAFIDDGVDAAGSLEEAIGASPVILICIDNYRITNTLLQSEKVASLLQGRCVVQLSTGTPLEASEAAAWMTAHEVFYLDGAILGGPDDITSKDLQILFCGEEEAYEKSGNLLACLSGRIRYLGSNIRTAATLDLAWLCDSYGQFLAISHAARICEAEDVGVDLYASVLPPDSWIQKNAEIIHSNNFANPTATLRIWRSALQPIRQQARDAGISPAFPDQVNQLLAKAETAGYGEQNVMAIVKVLREATNR